jgi:hypothetical protein
MSDYKYEKTIEELKAEVDRRSHPAAKVFPLLIDTDANAWEKFCADVGKKGLQDPILIDRPVTEAGRLILDGRNRELACLMLGIEAKYEVVNVSDSAAVARVISANLLRRHDDASVRAAQLAKLLELLKVENFPAPTVADTAAAAGISDRTLRDAGRLLKKDPELADQVAKGNLSMHAARHVSDLPPGEERDKAKQEIAAARNKKKSKGIVGNIRKRKKTQQKEFGNLERPGLTGAYNILLKTLESVPKLQHELRNLKNAPHQLSANGARELKIAVEGLKTTDFKDLLAATDVALKELDCIIARANVETEEEQPAATGNTADAMADDQSEAA